MSLYTQNRLLVLAYCSPEEDEEEEAEAKKTISRGHKSGLSTASAGSEPSGGIRRRQNNKNPELRLIDLITETETTIEDLIVSRYERLNASDYHLGVLPAQNVASAVATSRGALETLAGFGNDMWNAAINPKSLFSSGASVKSKDSNDGGSSSKVASSSESTLTSRRGGIASVPRNMLKPGIKIFMHSPYDCILATKCDLADHLGWLVKRERYQEAWELVDEHPEIVSPVDDTATGTGTPERTQTTDDFYEETPSITDGMRNFYSSAEREKRIIGDRWVQKLTKEGEWTRAGEICGKVLTSPEGWQKWFWAFANAKRLDDIVNYMPTRPMRPAIPHTIYEVALGHYIDTNKPKFRELLERWPTELFDLTEICTTLEKHLKFRDVREDSIEDGEVGRDWHIVMESLARLQEANGRYRESLRCYIKLQDADSAMRLIKDHHLANAVADDIPSFISLRVPQDQIDNMTLDELEHATLEAVTLLVDEAQHGLVKPSVVVSQLQAKELNPYTFFYLRALWKGQGIEEHTNEFRDRLVSDSKSLVDDFADLAIQLFAVYDRSLLMDFLKTSTEYTFEKVS
jgi:hypothetical protein